MLTYPSKLYGWLDSVDPYAIQRKILQKAFIVSTIMVMVYWFFKPTNFLAFVLPAFNVSIYEMPVFKSMKQKDQALLFSFAAMMICNLTFYLFFPFRLFFLLYAVVFFSALYFTIARYFPALKFLAILTIATCGIFMTVTPRAHLQTAYDMFCSSLLSMTVLFICLRALSRSYFTNWSLAQEKFIHALEKNIDSALKDKAVYFYVEEINHINTVYAYRCLLKKPYLLPAYKLSINLRHIQFALSNVYYEEKNHTFWKQVKYHLKQLRLHMKQKTACPWTPELLIPESTLQTLTIRYLHRATTQWNTLCTML